MGNRLRFSRIESVPGPFKVEAIIIPADCQKADCWRPHLYFNDILTSPATCLLWLPRIPPCTEQCANWWTLFLKRYLFIQQPNLHLCDLLLGRANSSMLKHLVQLSNDAGTPLSHQTRLNARSSIKTTSFSQPDTPPESNRPRMKPGSISKMMMEHHQNLANWIQSHKICSLSIPVLQQMAELFAGPQWMHTHNLPAHKCRARMYTRRPGPRCRQVFPRHSLRPLQIPRRHRQN
jgi:hypothetical protein